MISSKIIIHYYVWMTIFLTLAGAWLITYNIYGDIMQNDCIVIGYNCDQIKDVYVGVKLFENVKYIKAYISVRPDDTTSKCDMLKYMYPYNSTVTCNYYEYSRNNFSIYDIFNYDLLFIISIIIGLISWFIGHMYICYI